MSRAAQKITTNVASPTMSQSDSARLIPKKYRPRSRRITQPHGISLWLMA